MWSRYTSFDLHNLSIPQNTTTATGSFNLSLVATNTGAVDSAVPVQMYFRDPVCYPVRLASVQLVAFTKVFLRYVPEPKVTAGTSIALRTFFRRYHHHH